MVMFFRAKECSQSFWRRSSVIVLSTSISYLSRASVWTWVTHKLLVSSVILLIWIWAAEGTNKMRVRLLYSTAAGVFANCSNFWTSDELWQTCRSCIFKWWILMSLLKVWLTAPTVQFTSSRFSLSLFSNPDVSLRVKEIQLSCWPNYSIRLLCFGENPLYCQTNAHLIWASWLRSHVEARDTSELKPDMFRSVELLREDSLSSSCTR